MAKTHGEADENNFHYTVVARKLHKNAVSLVQNRRQKVFNRGGLTL